MSETPPYSTIQHYTPLYPAKPHYTRPHPAILRYTPPDPAILRYTPLYPAKPRYTWLDPASWKVAVAVHDSYSCGLTHVPTVLRPSFVDDSEESDA